LQIVGYPGNYLVGTNTLSYLTEEKKSYDICEWCTAGKRRQKQNISIVFLLTGPEV